jgi:2-iminobutanoate/2-iminopropanoate deaminase
MKKIIHTHDAPAPIGPYSQAVRIANTVYTSGQIAIDPKTGELTKGSISEETHQVMRNMQAVLNAAGLEFSQVVKSTIFITDMDDFGAINEVYGSYFDPETAPARETVQVSRLPKDVRVEISMIATD